MPLKITFIQNASLCCKHEHFLFLMFCMPNLILRLWLQFDIKIMTSSFFCSQLYIQPLKIFVLGEPVAYSIKAQRVISFQRNTFLGLSQYKCTDKCFGPHFYSRLLFNWVCVQNQDGVRHARDHQGYCLWKLRKQK